MKSGGIKVSSADLNSSADGDFIHQVDPLGNTHWDAVLATCPGASFFHGSGWARVLCDTYRFNPFYFAVGPPDRIRALLPIMEKPPWTTGADAAPTTGWKRARGFPTAILPIRRTATQTQDKRARYVN